MTRRQDILAAWLDTRRAMRLDAPALARRRARLWAGMAPTLAATPALAAYAGRPLADIPAVDTATMRADLAGWNAVGFARDAIVAAAQGAEQGGPGIVRDGIAAGLSTGTSGSRGVFLASERERARYIGQSIARLLPVLALLTGARIALVLRANSALYRDVGRGRFAFLHLPVGQDAPAMADALRRFGATVLIAPPRELAMLAAAGVHLPTLRRVFWGAEPMGALERDWIGSALGCRPDPIYQATEGFIAAACRYGALHLNDDSLEVELEPVPLIDACRPIVTDLHRHVQPMVRVRLDDLVRLDGRSCRCGFAGRVIAPVAGRVQDVWTIDAGARTPDVIDRHFEAAVGPAARWRVTGGVDRIALDATDAAHGERLHAAARQLVAHARVDVRIVADPGGAPKRRRVTWTAAA